jgi:Uma2 family endonuclease
MSTFAPAPTRIVYPESDGQPMAENTLQYECIVALQGGLDELRAEDFVGADNFWYPVEGRPDVRTAPDVYVAIGRPKRHRRSYQQWNEDGVAPQVVFEVLSPRNRFEEMRQKFEFYQRYGVQEYYIYNPDSNEWEGYSRDGDRLRPISDMGPWVSPRLGLRFDVRASEMRVLRPDGEPFKTYRELALLRREEEARRKEEEARRKEEEARRKEEEARRKEEEARRKEEEARRREAEGRAVAAEAQVEALKAKLRAAGIDPNGLPPA